MFLCSLLNCYRVVQRKNQHLKSKHRQLNAEERKEALSLFTRLTSVKKPRSSLLTNTEKQKKHPHSDEDGTIKEKPRTTDKKKQPMCKRPLSAEDEEEGDDTETSLQLDEDSDDEVEETDEEEVMETQSDEPRSSHPSVTNKKKHPKRPLSDEDEKEESDDDDEETDEEELYETQSDEEEESKDEESNKEWHVKAQDVTKWSKWHQKPPRGSDIKDQYMKSFCRYLKHIDGGANTEEQSFLMTSQVHIILKTLDAEGKDLECLVVIKSMNSWDQFCEPMMREKKVKSQTLYCKILTKK